MSVSPRRRSSGGRIRPVRRPRLSRARLVLVGVLAAAAAAPAPALAADTSPPTAPTGVRVTASGGLARFNVAWVASTDDVGVAGYDVFAGTTLVATEPGDQSAALGVSIAPDPNTQVTVVAFDAAGNRSAPSTSLTANTCDPNAVQIFPLPSAVSASDVTQTTASIAYTTTQLTPCSPSSGTPYVYSSDGTLLGQNGNPVPLTGLQPGTTYTVHVTIGAGLESSSSDPITFTTASVSDTTPPDTTPPATQALAYTAIGSATLKNLVKGSLPLSGLVNGTLTGSTGALAADLTLAQSTANLTALGFLPVTASVALLPTKQLTGTLTGTSLTASTTVRIKLPSVKTFGVTLAGGANCQAAQVSTIALRSVGAFVPVTGGTLAGTFSISNLTGCGALNGLVSPLTAGSANGISLSLKPGGVKATT